MVGIFEALSGCAGTCPAIFNAREPSLVEVRSPLCQFARSQDSRMPDRDAAERNDRQSQPCEG